MIKYSKRYSFNHLPDHMGRWARIAKYRDITIAWINRFEVNDKVGFSVSLYFPTLNNDLARDHQTFKTCKEAKNFIQERWDWFIEHVS